MRVYMGINPVTSAATITAKRSDDIPYDKLKASLTIPNPKKCVMSLSRKKPNNLANTVTIITTMVVFLMTYLLDNTPFKFQFYIKLLLYAFFTFMDDRSHFFNSCVAYVDDKSRMFF